MGVRVPRITLNADFGDDAAFGDLSLLSVGYGLHQAWVFATMFGTTSIFGTQTFVSGLYDSQVSLVYMISIAAYVACLFIVAATNQRFLERYTSKKFITAGALFATAGTLVLLAPLAEYVILEVVAGVLTGIGSSILILAWGTAFARSDSASIILNTGIAISISIIIYALGLLTLPYPLTGWITATIPLLELAILWKKTPQSFNERGELPFFKPLPVNHTRFIVRFATPVLVFGIALGMLRQTSIQYIIPTAGTTEQLLMLFVAGCATVLILVTIIAIGGSDRWNRFFRPLVPFIAVTLLFLPFSTAENSTISNFILMLGYLCFEALMWIFFSVLSQRFRLSPLFVFGIGRGVLAIAILIGSLFPVMAASQVSSIPFGEQSMAIVVMLTMVVAYALLPREREIEAIVIPCPLVKAVSSSLDETHLVFAAQEEFASTAKQAQTASQLSSASQFSSSSQHPGATQFPSTSQLSNISQLPNASQYPSTSQLSNTSQPDSSSTAKSFKSTDSSAPDASHPTPQQKRGRFRLKCETVANTYLLSQRETEVMFFLAKGHNAAYIQEKLYISEGTAKTHIRHIYRKTNVHTQQELMRLVESVEFAE